MCSIFTYEASILGRLRDSGDEGEGVALEEAGLDGEDEVGLGSLFVSEAFDSPFFDSEAFPSFAPESSGLDVLGSFSLFE